MNLSEVSSEEISVATPEANSASSDSSQLRVHILEFSRHPASLRQALLHGDDLAACRDALAKHCLEPLQPCGATVFTDPEDFTLVLDALQDLDLKPWHVVVSSAYLDAVQAAVGRLRSREQVRQKSNSTVDVPKQTCQTCGNPRPRFACGRCHTTHYCSRECQRADYKQHVTKCAIVPEVPVIVSKTFLDIKLPSSMQSRRSAVTKSTTDADARKGVNPRALGGLVAASNALSSATSQTAKDFRKIGG